MGRAFKTPSRYEKRIRAVRFGSFFVAENRENYILIHPNALAIELIRITRMNIGQM